MSPRLKLSWLAVALVSLVALTVGALGETGASTQQERVYELAAKLKCPQCAGQSVAESDSAIARQIRTEIADQLQQGRSDPEILDDISAGYEADIRLDTPNSGVTGLVWMLPVVVFVLAAAGLVVVFRRWSSNAHHHASTIDQELVAAELAARSRGDRDQGQGATG